jgi:glutamate--cysteine ligase
MDPGAGWVRYALRAPVMLAHDPEPVAVTSHVPFRDWVDGRVALRGRRPTFADLDYHLTTMFPPVRPRQWLEIRYLDSVPDALWPALAFLVVILLDDPEVSDIAAAATAPVADAWETAARVGLADRRLHESAIMCVHAAAARVPDDWRTSMEQLVRMVECGACPGDAFAERVIRHGMAEEVIRSAVDGG